MLKNRKTENILLNLSKFISKSQNLGLKELLSFALDNCAESLNADFSFIYIDNKTDSFPGFSQTIFQHKKNYSESDLKNDNFNIFERKNFLACIESKKSIFADINQHANENHNSEIFFKNELYIPILENENLWCVLGFYNLPDDFSEVDTEVITSYFNLVKEVFSNRLMKIKNFDSERSNSDESLNVREVFITEPKELFEQAFENSPSIIAINDFSSGKYILVNKCFLELTGYSKEEVIGSTTLELGILQPEEREEIIQNLISGKKVETRIVEFKHKNGQAFTCNYTGKIINVNGKTRLLSIAHDLSEKIKIENKLAESEEKFKILFDRTPSNYQSLDINGNFVNINETFINTLGYSKEEILGKNFSYILTPESVPKFKENFPKFIKSGKVQDVEFTLVKKNGERIVVNLRGKIGYNNKGEFLQTHCLFDEVTEEKIAKDKLVLSEEKFRNVYENASLGFIIWDANLNILQWNSRAEEIFGYPESDAVGKNLLELLIPESSVEKIFATVGQLKKGVNNNVLDLFKTKSGKLIWCQWYNTILHDTSGNINSFLSSVLDINEQKINQDELINQKNTLNAIFDSSPYIMCLVDENRHVVKLNKRGEQFINSHDNLIEKKSSGEILKCLQSVEFDGCGKREVCENCVLKNSINETFENKSISKNIETTMQFDIDDVVVEKTLMISTTPVIRNNEKNVLVTIVDVSEQKENERLLRKLSLVVEQSPVSIVITNYKGDIEYVNPRFTHITGYTFDEVVGQNPRVLKSGEQSGEFYHKMWETISSGKEWIGIFGNKRKNGEVFWESAIISPLKDESGKIINFVAIKEDITDKLRKEEELDIYRKDLENLVEERTVQLEESKRKLENEFHKSKLAEQNSKKAFLQEKELSEMKSHFISMASHEFRTPLTTIQSSTDLIKHYAKQNKYDNIDKHINKIQLTVAKLAYLLEEVLTLSRTDQSKIKFNASKVKLKSLIVDVIYEIETKIQDFSRIETNFEFENKDYLLDANLLKHILKNLLDNATKFSAPEEKIKLDVNINDEELNIVVQDFGIGIEKKEYNTIFEPFYRAANSIGYEGNGLGLSIVKRFIDMHSGRISVESQINIGSIFSVTLPIENRIPK